jgi:hypothetical protein
MRRVTVVKGAGCGAAAASLDPVSAAKPLMVVTVTFSNTKPGELPCAD